MYCGRLQKKANDGACVGNCWMYLILMYFPFVDGGGVASIISCSTSLSFDVGIFLILFSCTRVAVSSAL